MSRIVARASGLALPAFFAAKMAVGIALLKFSALFLTGLDFAAFSQFLLLSALLNMVASGGLQMGLILEVATAKCDARAEARLIANALAIWAGAALAFALPMTLLRGELSELLLGTNAYAAVVPWVVLLSVASGPGQVFTALLTGRQRPGRSLLAQAVGLLLGGAGALACLALHRPIAAVYAFALGPIVTALIAFALAGAHRLALRLGEVRRAEMGRLLRYSGAYVVTASLFPAMLFAQRHFYVSAFGVDALNDWLVANRVSDSSTQLLALYMAQYFLPSFAAAAEDARDRSILRAVAIGGAMMLGFLAVFAAGADLFIPLLLARQFLPAEPKILAYMAGDVLRVMSSVALHVALGQGRLLRYLGIEATTVAIFGVITGTLIALGDARAPYIGYAGTYLLIALAAVAAYLRGRVTRRRDLPTAIAPARDPLG